MSSTTCNGCGIPFGLTHLLKNHRKTERCGGRFLSAEEKSHQANLELQKDAVDKALRSLRSAANYKSYLGTSR